MPTLLTTCITLELNRLREPQPEPKPDPKTEPKSDQNPKYGTSGGLAA